MSVKSRGDSFQVDFRWGTQRVRKSFTDKPAALAWEAEAKSKLAKGLPIEEVAGTGDGMTMESLKEAVIARHWKGKSNEDAATRNADEVVELLGASRHPRDIKTQDIDKLVSDLKAKGNSGATVNRKLAALSKMMSHALSRGIIDRKPHIDRETEKEGRLRWYTIDEETAILGTLVGRGETDLWDLVVFLVDTGCRVGEALKLEWREIDDVFVRFIGRKAGNSSGVPLTPRVHNLLKRRRGDAKPTDRVFGRWTYDSAIQAWNRVRDAVGLKDDPQAVLHALRHTCASRLVQAGTPIQVVQQWLGHRSLNMTLRYAHLAPVNLLTAVAHLAKLVDTTGDSVLLVPATQPVVTSVTNVTKSVSGRTENMALAS